VFHPKDGVDIIIELSRRLNRWQSHGETNSSVERLLDDISLGLDERERDIRMLRNELSIDVLESQLLGDALLIVLFSEKWFGNGAHSLRQAMRKMERRGDRQIRRSKVLENLRERLQRNCQEPQQPKRNEKKGINSQTSSPLLSSSHHITSSPFIPQSASHLLPVHKVQCVVRPNLSPDGTSRASHHNKVGQS
jgi:hypothetical protein